MANLDERVMENYAHAGNLKSRIDIYRYRTPRYDPVEVAAALLGAVFGSVEEVEKEGVVRVPEPGPLLAYFGSLRNWVDCADEDFEAFMKAATNLSVDHFAEHETFDFTKTTVFYRCRGSAR